jgi:hypothetical protein
MSCKKACLGVLALMMGLAGCGGEDTAGGGTAGTMSGTSGVGGGVAGTTATAGTVGTAGTTGVGTAGATAAGSGTAGDGAAGTGIAGGVDPTAGANGNVDTLKAKFPLVTDWAALEIVYPTSYSAFDGEHIFKVPFRVQCRPDLPVSAWSADPPSAVTFDAYNDDMGKPLGVMVTIVEPVAEVFIAAVDGTMGGTAPLKITIGRPEQWAFGEERYNNGADWAGIDMTNPLNTMAPPPDTKCTACHSENSAQGFDIQHTPTQLARASDDAITQIMTTGTKPADVPFRVLPEMITFGTMTLTNADLYKEFHLWEGTPDQLKGMILYLRSLTPTGQGCVMDPISGMCQDVEADPNEGCM